jgi:hypothetical protein
MHINSYQVAESQVCSIVTHERCTGFSFLQMRYREIFMSSRFWKLVFLRKLWTCFIFSGSCFSRLFVLVFKGKLFFWWRWWFWVLELSALHLLTKCSTPWVTPPALCDSLIFQIWSHIYIQGKPRLNSSCLYFCLAVHHPPSFYWLKWSLNNFFVQASLEPRSPTSHIHLPGS